ncbi:MAG: 3-deoxy-D-manno-octulosonic acid transferase [Pikeienuella sp.]
MRRSAALGLYLAASACAEPLARRLLARRASRGKEDPARLGERFGHASAPRPDGRLIWLHAASVGEAVSSLPLLDALAQADPCAGLLLTTGTRTAAEAVTPRLPATARHQFAPVDVRAAVRRFLDHWRPDLAVWVESEIWPRLMVETARARVPMALVNARLSEASARGWARAPAMAARLLGLFRMVLAQDGASADRLGQLGAGQVERGGTLKSAVIPPADPAAHLELATLLAGRRVWLAASTHDDEEARLALTVAATDPEALLILAPRHPERGAEVHALLQQAGLATARRAAGETPGPETRIWLADTLGEMGLWYRLAEAVFVGGSWVRRGGHTPFEPAALCRPILHGPHVENFAEAYAELAKAGGARRIERPEALAQALAELFADPAAATRMGAAAAACRANFAPDLPALAQRLLGLVGDR